MKGYKIDDPQEIRMKILACDEKYCTHNFLENLSKFLPNPEQVHSHPPRSRATGRETTDSRFAIRLILRSAS